MTADIEETRRALQQLADECIRLGTPFHVRAKVKAALSALEIIETARKRA